MKNENNQKQIISVCIPCYNVSKFLNNLFACLDNQTFKSFKIIFIDDGSTDDTYAKILEYQKTSKYEVIVETQKNGGIAITRNKLLDLADTEYLFFIDPDDEIPSKSLETLYTASENGKYDIVSGRSKVIFNDLFAVPFIVSYRYKKNITSGHYVKSNLCTIWASLFKASVFKHHRFLENYIFEDLGLLTYLFLKTPNFKQIKNIVYHYNRRKKITSLSTFTKINRWKFIDLYEQTKYAFNFYEQENWLADKKYVRQINGTLFQIIIATLWLSKHFSNNTKIACLPMWQVLDCLKHYGVTLKFSKTFWKSLSFFYLNWHGRYSKISEFIKSGSNPKHDIVLTRDDFFEDLPRKLVKQKIYFLKPEYGENISDIVTHNPKSTFFVDRKYKHEFSLEHLNVSFGTQWSEYSKDNKGIQFVDARSMGLIDRKTLEKFINLPKWIIVLLDLKNISIPHIKTNLNFVFL